MKEKTRRYSLINLLCEFKDRELEKKYFSNEIKVSIKLMRPVALFLSIVYLLFIIPDFILISDQVILLKILLNRCLVLCAVIILYFFIKNSEKHKHVVTVLTVYEIFISLSFMVIFYQYENPTFLIQVLAVIIIILVVFMIPNRWVNKIAVSLIIFIEFFAISLLIFSDIKFNEYWAAVAYVLLVIIFSSINSYQIAYFKRIQYKNNKDLELISITDPLTGIYNRGKFNKGIELCIKIYKERGVPFSLIIFDIDDLKGINDKYGHLIGDRVIKEVVNIIKKEIREADIFFRWGGDEFVLLLMNTDIKQAGVIAERIRALIDNFDFHTAKHITCSFGVVSYQDGDNADSLLIRGDNVLYRAKEKGKNTVEGA